MQTALGIILVLLLLATAASLVAFGPVPLVERILDSILRGRFTKASTYSGSANLVGQTAEVRRPFEDSGDGQCRGKVCIAGEIWSAVSMDSPARLSTGSLCTVIAQDGSVLHVNGRSDSDRDAVLDGTETVTGSEASRLAELAIAVRGSTMKRLRSVPPGSENWRPTAGSLSIADIVQHLIDADQWFFDKLADPGLPSIKAVSGSVTIETRAEFELLLDRLDQIGGDRARLLSELSQSELQQSIRDDRFDGPVSVWWVIVRAISTTKPITGVSWPHTFEPSTLTVHRTAASTSHEVPPDPSMNRPRSCAARLIRCRVGLIMISHELELP